jgi:hypothetical protein
MDRPELPLDRYGDLMVQADLAMFARAGADGGDWEVEQEDFIAACMKEAGFEYQPRAVAPLVEGESDIKAGVRRLSLPWLAEDLAQVERYGYGYSTAGEIVENAPLDDPAEPDPNAAYLASLSESARRAYDVAMVGSAHAAYIDSGLPDGVAAPEIGGCAGAARLAHPDAAAAVMSDAPSALYQGLLTQMYEMGWAYGASYLGRADLEALDAAWRECFERDVSLAPLDPSPAPGTGADPPPEPLGPSELDGPSAAWTLAYFWTDGGESWDPGPSGDNPAPAGYMSLTGTPREIAIAVADYKCRQETDYVATFLAIEGRAQEDFIAAHRAELDQMVAAAERYIGG